MNKMKEGTFTQKENIELRSNDRAAIVIEHYKGEKDGGWMENNIEVRLGMDGSLSFSDREGEGFIYFYKEQVKFLEKFLKDSHR